MRQNGSASWLKSVSLSHLYAEPHLMLPPHLRRITMQTANIDGGNLSLGLYARNNTFVS